MTFDSCMVSVTVIMEWEAHKYSSYHGHEMAIDFLLCKKVGFLPSQRLWLRAKPHLIVHGSHCLIQETKSYL